VNGFIDHLNTGLGNTSNYSATADLHNSQIITAPAKPLPACYIFTSRSMSTVSNSGDSSASRAQVLSSQRPVQNSLSTQICPLLITSRHGQHRKHRSSIVAFVFVAAGTCLPRLCPETAAARTTENTFLLLCLRVCCGRYLTTAAVYIVSA
jgi:hypothetical protein